MHLSFSVSNAALHGELRRVRWDKVSNDSCEQSGHLNLELRDESGAGKRGEERADEEEGRLSRMEELETGRDIDLSILPVDDICKLAHLLR